MLPLSLVAFGWCESLALVLLVLALLGAPWPFWRVVLAATLQCAGMAVLRSLPMAMGTHTVLGVILLALLVSWLFSLSFGRSLVAGGCAIVLLLAIEFGVAAAAHYFFGPEINPNLWLLMGIPHVVILVTLALIARRYKIVLFR